MQTRIENDVVVITSEDGMDLYNNFLECNAGKECWLGYVYYDKDSNLLNPPYLLEPKDFTEIPEEVRENSLENNDETEDTDPDFVLDESENGDTTEENA